MVEFETDEGFKYLDPEKRLYPVILRNTGSQHILFKVKIRRKQVEDWIVYPVMGVILPQSMQTIYRKCTHTSGRAECVC